MRSWRKGSGAPTPTTDQHAQRLRRRRHLRVTYDATFNLAEEVRAIFTPLAERVTALPVPASMTGRVMEAADAVHELMKTVGRMLAEQDARRRTAHLNVAVRGSAIQQLLELAERPEPPEISVAQVKDGSWTSVLVAVAESYTGPLSEYLGAIDPALTGNPSVAERLEGALRFVDQAAAGLERRLDFAASSAAAPAAPPIDHKAQIRAQLTELGVEM